MDGTCIHKQAINYKIWQKIYGMTKEKMTGSTNEARRGSYLILGLKMMIMDIEFLSETLNHVNL
jgi:hypothetical protein